MTKAVKSKSKKANTNILEQGDIFFFYRPKVRSAEHTDEYTPEGIEAIQRFYLVLHPNNKNIFRLIIIGRKRLPEINGQEITWGITDKIAKDPNAILAELQAEKHTTKTRGERIQPAARAAGEGIYCIASHQGHTHLAYALELPKQPDAVQAELQIEPQASYIIAIKNQAIAGTTTGKTAEFPASLQSKMGKRRFVTADPPEFLNYANAEILLIGATVNASAELEITFNTENETEHSADIFSELKFWREQHSIEPLFKGDWK